IEDLDVDRYDLDGDREQVLVSARELDLQNIPNKSWQGEHLVSTRGCGPVVAPVGRLTDRDRPDYVTLPLDRPELYFSPSMTGYAVLRTDATESSCGDNEPYTGGTGVDMGGFFRRAVFALGFLDYNIVGSGSI